MSGLPPASVDAGASATAGTSNASGSSAPPPQPRSATAASASTASSPAQTNISLPTSTGPTIDSATRASGRKRPREEEETPELATDATASETATPSNTPPSVHVPAAMQFPPPGICASATDDADDGMGQGSNSNSDDGTDDEIDQAMAGAQGINRNGENEGETVVPALPPVEHLFRHMIDSSERLGCVAHSPNPRECLYWKITEVAAGSQAETLGILVGHYIISVDGQRLVNGTSLTEAFQRAVSVGKPFEVVTSDFPVRAAAAGRVQQQLLGNSDSGSEESSVNSDDESSASRTGTALTPEQNLDDTERELPVSPEIRRAMTVENSPASKSPYHAFDRVSKSIVPGSAGAISLEFGVFRFELRKLIKQCTRRLCIFPQDGRPWLDYALNLVFASLWYNAPDRALGWNVAIDEHRLKGLGMRAELQGPQPWMATRAFIVQCIKHMLEAENNDWVTSSARKAALRKHHEPRIKQYLKAWNNDLSKAGHSQLLQAYSDHVWTDFMAKHMATNDGVGALHKLSERWIIQSACEFSSSDVASIAAPPSSPDPAILDRIRSIVDGKSCSCASNGVRLCKCKKLPLELYPFAKNRELVVSAVLRRFQENRKALRVGDVTKESVRSILDDMEDETGFITKLNGLFTVTVAAASKLFPDSEDNNDKSTSDDDLEPQLESTVEDRGVSVHSTIEKGAQWPQVAEKGVSFSSDSDDALSNVGTRGDSSLEIGHDRCDNDIGQQEQSPMTSTDAGRQYSTSTDVGSRVYARFTAGDDEYYWGTVKAKREGLLTVLFDDGIQHDVVDDDTCVVTEKEYACLFSTPPSPPKKRARREIASADLCGRGYCHPYTDKEGKKRVVYGVVSHRLDGEAYTIEFDKNCISSFNKPTEPANDPLRMVKPTQNIPSDLVIAGCIAYDRITKASNRIEKLSRKTPLRYLVVPEMRHEEQVEYNGIQVPKLTIVLRAHQLVFSIKKSNVGDNATLGVFVKCTSLLDNTSAFGGNTRFLGSVLKKGELLDLGVFNGSSCIKHLNQCGPKDVPSIHEEFDPEGSRHHYFGVRYHGDYQRYKSECSRLDLTINEDEEVELFLFDAAASRRK